VEFKFQNVIPGKLTIASATRNPGSSKIGIPVFTGMTTATSSVLSSAYF
jgi:hypothetical protein